MTTRMLPRCLPCLRSKTVVRETKVRPPELLLPLKPDGCTVQCFVFVSSENFVAQIQRYDTVEKDVHLGLSTPH